MHCPGPYASLVGLRQVLVDGWSQVSNALPSPDSCHKSVSLCLGTTLHQAQSCVVVHALSSLPMLPGLRSRVTSHLVPC